MDSLNNKKNNEEESIFRIDVLFPMFLNNWKWFVISVVLCLSLSYVYLRHTPRVYSALTKVLIKDDESGMRRSTKSALQNVENLGIMTNSTGIDNEVEILNSPATVEDVVRKLDLNIDYSFKEILSNQVLYKNQPIVAIVSQKVEDEDFLPIYIELKQKNKTYEAKVSYSLLHMNTQTAEPIDTVITFNKLPFTINTQEGSVTLTKNALPHRPLLDKTLQIRINSYLSTAVMFSNSVSVAPTSKMTTIAEISFVDLHPRRATDFLEQLVKSYNEMANEDKNEIARRTEEFINGRLEKIDSELGSTESQLESYKRSNNVFELRQKTQAALTQRSQYEQKLIEASTQIELLTGLQDYIHDPSHKYEAMPFNVGLQDQPTIMLIQKYNEAIIQRKRLLVTSSEQSPAVIALTTEAEGLLSSLKQAIDHAIRSARTVYKFENEKLHKYSNELELSPSQERVLTQIGRQQEVRSDIYLMLLQKREENSISLAATADKGKMIFKPLYGGVVSPKGKVIMLIGLAIGILLPFAILILIQMLRFKIEGREDVEKLTNVPILAELASINDEAKMKGEIVVQENKNRCSEEMFRLMRTNLLFTMKENEKIITFTSNIPGEGKTFAASNLAVSFALYNKKVLLVGLDIRKPRLSDLFEINNHHNGISVLLQKTSPTEQEIKNQIVPSGIHSNLDLLMAGPIPPNPSELIGRPSLGIILDKLKEHYDYIILDTAPVSLVTDTLQIGHYANATVFVCRANHTPKACFKYINEIVKENKLPNVSIAINGVDFNKKSYRYGHYRHYGTYSYTYSEEEDNTIKK